MKRIRFTVSLLLTAAMLLSVLPLGVFAAKETITRVDLYGFALPFAKQESSTIKRLTTIANAPYEIYSQVWEEPSSGNDVLSTFEEDTVYRLLVRVEPKDGYRFDAGAMPLVTFDSSAEYVDADRAWIDNEGCLICYSISTKPIQVEVLGIIEIEGYCRPREGSDPQENVKSLKTPAGAHYRLQASWYCETDSTSIFSAFEAGKAYSLFMAVEPVVGSVFWPTSRPQVLLNGSESGMNGEATIVDNYYKLRCYSVNVTPAASEAIEDVGIYGYQKPFAGQTVYQNTKYLRVEDDAPYSLGEDTGWYRLTSLGEEQEKMSINDSFEEGETYRLRICLVPKATWFFNRNALPTIRINGASGCVNETYTRTPIDGTLIFCVNSVEVISSRITQVDLYGFCLPTVWQTVSENLSGLIVPSGAGWSITQSYWYNFTDDAVMNDSDWFEAGKYYFYWYTVAPSDGWTFDPGCAFYIDGSDEYIYRKVQNANGVYYIFAGVFIPQSAQDLVSEANVVGFAAPRANYTVGSNLSSIRMPLGANYSVTQYGWFTGNGTPLSDSDVFEGGAPYYFSCRIAPSFGYSLDPACLFKLDGNAGFTDDTRTVWNTDGSATVFSTVFVTDISEISVIAVVTPIAGMATSFFTKAETPDDAHYSVRQIYWTAANGSPIAPVDTFSATERYRLVIELTADDGYEFSDASTPILNGGNALIDDSRSGYVTNVVNPFYRITSVEITPSERVGITEINLIVDRFPVAGLTPADLPVPRVAYYADYQIEDWCWYNGNDPMEDDEVFAANGNYQLYARIETVSSAYYFPENAVITVNGSTVQVDDFSGFTPDTGTAYVYTVELPVTQVISEAGAEGYKLPIAGETAGGNLALLTLPNGAHYSIGETKWFSFGTSRYMNESDVFEADTNYYIVITLVPDEGYIFSNDHRPTVYINGSGDDVGFLNVYEDRVEVYGENVAASSRLRGDVNGDGDVNVADVSRLLDILAGNVQTQTLFDLNNDGECNVADVSKLLDILAGEN